MRYSKLMSLLTAGYGAFAVVKPSHLGDAVQTPAVESAAMRRLAYTYGGRDLAISGLAIGSSNPSVVTAAMLLRIVGDVADATVLSATTKQSVRPKVLGVTLTWAALNTVALLADRRALR